MKPKPSAGDFDGANHFVDIVVLVGEKLFQFKYTAYIFNDLKTQELGAQV